MKFKVGDTVKMDLKVIFKDRDEVPDWYNSESYTIVKIGDKGYGTVFLDRNINDYTSNQISAYYLYIDIKDIRMMKLKQLGINTEE